MRSAFAAEPGVPWWGAVLIAATATLIGIGIEAGSGHQELGGIFAVCYALGCLAAVLAVRRSALFTAVIQPPLVLFVAVPLAYYLFHESSFAGLKDALITCGYPLIERFPLMLFTSAAVLLLGLVRWYFAAKNPRTVVAAGPARAGLLAGLSTKLASAFAGNGSVDEEAGTRPARPRHVADRAGGSARARRPREQAGRSRHARPAAEFADAPPRQRSRRPVRDDERAAQPRRRPRERDPRRTPPPPRRDPRERDYAYGDPSAYRGPVAPRPSRGSRYEPYEPGRGYQSHPQYGAYPPYEPRRRPAPGRSGTDQHPVSRVRYRDTGPHDPDHRPR